MVHRSGWTVSLALDVALGGPGRGHRDDGGAIRTWRSDDPQGWWSSQRSSSNSAWHVLRPWIDTEPLDLIEPAITLGVGQLRSAPRAVVDAHVRAAAVMNDEAVLPELRYVCDEMVRALLGIWVLRAAMFNELTHLVAAVRDHEPKVLVLVVAMETT